MLGVSKVCFFGIFLVSVSAPVFLFSFFLLLAHKLGEHVPACIAMLVRV